MEKEAQALISIVVPAYNEAEVLPQFYARVSQMLDHVDFDAEMLFVNDGSEDSTLRVLDALADKDPRVSIIDLSRNFGKEVALTAGLDHARGAAVVLIDADLQDPPELIPRLVDVWRSSGYDVVYAQRTKREGETWLKKATAYAFYRLIRRIARVHIPEDTGDFRLLSRRAVDALKEVREHHRFMKGLFAWIGYRQKAVPYVRDVRHAGRTKWNYWKLWNFALEGFTSFTIAPLKVSTYLGLVVAAVSFAFGAFIIYKTVVFGDPVKGYPSLMVVTTFLGATQLIALGVIGEYLGRVSDEAKRRPLYFAQYMRPAAIFGGNQNLKVVNG